METILVLIKPDGVARNLIPEILHRFQQAGLKIEKMKMGTADEGLATKHYVDLKDRQDIYWRNVNTLQEGPLVAVVFSGRNAILRARVTCGATEPIHGAQPGTIRGDFGNDTIHDADSEKRGLENLVHASDSAATAAREITLWFP
jgi:nucleoside-diphosphate kinase